MDELLGRGVPYSMEAEQSVIGSMIIDSRCVPEVVEILKPEDLSTNPHIEPYINVQPGNDPVTTGDESGQNMKG